MTAPTLRTALGSHIDEGPHNDGGQLAIAWVLAQGRQHDDIVALIGARRPDRITEALPAAELTLTDQDLAEIDEAVPASAVAGERYAAPQLAQLDSER